MSTGRKLLLALLLVGNMTTHLGAGTFASFSATTTNPGSTFSTGTIVLSNTVGSGTTCFSTGPGTTTDTNANAACDALLPATVQQPGAFIHSQLTLKNEGSVAGTLSGVGVSCQTTDVADEITPFHGTGDLCGDLLVQIQEFTGPSFGVLSVAPSCVWPVKPAESCAALGDFTTLDELVTATATTPLVVADPTVGAGESRYLRVAIWWIDLGPAWNHVHNQFMGRQADFDIRWDLVQ